MLLNTKFNSMENYEVSDPQHQVLT